LQLRDLVPPQQKESNSNLQDNLDPSKRPKHVVLSDTISLVKALQQKVSYCELDPVPDHKPSPCLVACSCDCHLNVNLVLLMWMPKC
jgi:hypothetical protein